MYQSDSAVDSIGVFRACVPCKLKMAPKFSAIEDEKLINAIGLHRAIYDSENVDYKNQHIKDNIWEVIAKETERSGK